MIQVDIQTMKTGHYPSGKNKVIDLMKEELGGKIMTEFVALKAKMCAYKKRRHKSGGETLQRHEKGCGC